MIMNKGSVFFCLSAISIFNVISAAETTTRASASKLVSTTTPTSSSTTTTASIPNHGQAEANYQNMFQNNVQQPFGSFSVQTPNFIPLNDVTLQQMFMNQVAPQLASASNNQQQIKSDTSNNNNNHGAQSMAASEDNFPGFGFGTHPASDMGTIIDPGFQSAMASLNPMASMAEGLEFMKPSFESAAALHSDELNSSPFSGQSLTNQQFKSSASDMFGVSRSGFLPLSPGTMAPVFTPDRPPIRSRKNRRQGSRRPAETRTYHSEFEYSAPRREKTSYRNARPSVSASEDSYGPPPPPPTSSGSYQDSYQPTPSGRRGRKMVPKDNSDVKRYNSRETEFYNSDANFDSDASSDGDAPQTPRQNKRPSTSSIPHGPPSGPVDGYRGPSSYQNGRKQNLKEGETFVEGYEWKGDPVPISKANQHAQLVNDEEARKRQEESSYSYTHIQKDKPKDGARNSASKFSSSSGRQNFDASDIGDDDEETRKQELRTTYDSNAGGQHKYEGQRSPPSAPSSSSYSTFSDSPPQGSPPSMDKSSQQFPTSYSYPQYQSKDVKDNSNSRLEGPQLKFMNQRTPSYGSSDIPKESASNLASGDEDKEEVEEDNSDVIPPGYEEVKF